MDSHRLYRLSNGQGTVLVGHFDFYQHIANERSAGWYGHAQEWEIGSIDFIIKGGPVVTLECTDYVPNGWTWSEVDE